MINYSSSNGYPTIFVNGKNVLLHRYVWEKHNGEIPSGCEIHHKNKDRYDFSIENLELINKSEHHKQHALEHALGVSNKGKCKNHVSGACPEKHPVIAIKGEEIIKFDSISSAIKQLKVDGGSIWRILKGERKSAKGWVFLDGV